MTEKLYDKDAYATEFQGVVLSCEETKNGFSVTLDQTLFYPEGGGQPGDRGFLNDIPVTDTHEKGGIIFHETTAAFTSGQKVRGKINWAHRFDLMQNHSGEHIISGIICKKYGCDNVGFHMGRDKITIDFNHKIPTEDLPALEEKANEAIWQNTEIEVSLPTEAALQTLDYRSKILLAGAVRIVKAGEFDCCACCGTHVKSAGEIGIIKIVGVQNYKGGTRLELLSGKRALAHYREKNNAADGVGVLLSVQGTGILEAVQHLLAQREEMTQQISKLKGECFESRIAALPQGATDICYYAADFSGKDLTTFSDGILAKTGSGAMVFTPSGEGYAFVLLRSTGDAREMTEALKKKMTCKGGGKPQAVQGYLEGKLSDIFAFFEEQGFDIENHG